MLNKLKSYIGFAKKSNSIIYGIDNLEKTNKNISLIIISENISDRSLKSVINLKNKNEWKTIKLKNINLDELLSTNNCKIIGILNKDLVKAILNLSNYFDII